MIKLELSVEECNMILRVLGKHPFEEVVSVINKIKQQGEPQVAAMAEAEKSAELPAA
jgi:biopolymer transport protein ExbD